MIILYLMVKTFAALSVFHALLILTHSGTSRCCSNRLQQVLSFSNNSTREISFFSQAIRIASLRILASIVLRSNSLSSSRILNRCSFASEMGTTASPALTADSVCPFMHQSVPCKQLVWVQTCLQTTANMLILGGSVSSTMAFFSLGANCHRRCTDVIISTGPIDTFFHINKMKFIPVFLMIRIEKVEFWKEENYESQSCHSF